MPEISCRRLLQRAAGLTGALTLGGLAACSGTGAVVAPTADAVAAAEALQRIRGRSVVSARLNAPVRAKFRCAP